MNAWKAWQLRQYLDDNKPIMHWFRGESAAFCHSHLPQMKDYVVDIFFRFSNSTPVSGGIWSQFVCLYLLQTWYHQCVVGCFIQDIAGWTASHTMFRFDAEQQWLKDVFDAFAFVAWLSLMNHECPSTIIRLSCCPFFQFVEKLAITWQRCATTIWSLLQGSSTCCNLQNIGEAVSNFQQNSNSLFYNSLHAYITYCVRCLLCLGNDIGRHTPCANSGATYSDPEEWMLDILFKEVQMWNI